MLLTPEEDAYLRFKKKEVYEVKRMQEERKKELLQIAKTRAADIINSWWYEIGSWDDIVEDEVTVEEWHYILDNFVVTTNVEM